MAQSDGSKKKKVRRGLIKDGAKSYHVYIKRLFKDIDGKKGGMSLSSQATTVLDQMAHYTISKIMKEANRVKGARATLSGKDVEAALKITLGLRNVASSIANMQKAYKEYTTQAALPSGHIRYRKEDMADLTFSVSRVAREMRRHSSGCGCRLSQSASIYMASLVEDVIAGLIAESITAAKHNKRKIVQPTHIKLALRNDVVLDSFFDRLIFTPGVQPHIHSAFLKKKVVKKASAPKKSASAPKPKKSTSAPKKSASKPKKNAAPKRKTSASKTKKAAAPKRVVKSKVIED